MKLRFTLLSAILVLVSVTATGAQAIKVPENWDRLAAKADEVVNVTLDKKMLGLASKFMDDENDAAGKRVISKLNGIYVRSLEFKNPGEFTAADVEPIHAQLQGPEWAHIVSVNSKTEKENVGIYIKTVNNQTVGMVILAEEPTELTFVQLDGPVNSEDLDELSGNFGIPKGVHAAPPNKVPQSKAEVKE
jgi:Domain of unknown function (DUF4252)